MRLGRVIGTATISRRLSDLKPGRYLIVDAFDGWALAGRDTWARRKNPMPESLIVFDQLGAGVGQVIAISEGREAAMPFYPERVPIDSYCAAILDEIVFEE